MGESLENCQKHQRMSHIERNKRLYFARKLQEKKKGQRRIL